MQLHANAALSLNGRRKMVLSVCEGALSLTDAAQSAGVTVKTCRKWCARYRAEGEAGLLDRSSAPASIPNRTDEQRVEAMRATLERERVEAKSLAASLEQQLAQARMGVRAAAS